MLNYFEYAIFNGVANWFFICINLKLEGCCVTVLIKPIFLRVYWLQETQNYTHPKNALRILDSSRTQNRCFTKIVEMTKEFSSGSVKRWLEQYMNQKRYSLNSI